MDDAVQRTEVIADGLESRSGLLLVADVGRDRQYLRARSPQLPDGEQDAADVVIGIMLADPRIPRLRIGQGGPADQGKPDAHGGEPAGHGQAKTAGSSRDGVHAAGAPYLIV